jgi:hypothetical protein
MRTVRSSNITTSRNETADLLKDQRIDSIKQLHGTQLNYAQQTTSHNSGNILKSIISSAAESVRRDSGQPVPRPADERARPSVSSVARSQEASRKRRLERVTIWVEREVWTPRFFYRPSDLETAEFLERSLGRRSGYAHSESVGEGSHTSEAALRAGCAASYRPGDQAARR